MTRWARGGDVNRKKELSATPWSKLKQTKSLSKKQKTKSQYIKLPQKSKIKICTEDVTDNSVLGTKAGFRKSNKTKRRMGLLDSKIADEEISSQNDRDLSSDSSDDEKEVGVAGLLEQMKSQQVDEVFEAIHKDERREKRRLKRIDKRQAEMTCYNCRKQGHDMSNCPAIRRDSSQGTGICFKCGSTEHSINKCHLKLPSGVFPYAKCFICKEIGHLSKQCPDNPRGLYPNGGCCKWCSSVEHYKKDCPALKKKQGIEDIRLDQWNASTNRSADEDSYLNRELPAKKYKVHKVVKF